MKHRQFLSIFTVLVIFSNTLNAQQVRTIWNSKKSNEDRYTAVSKIKNASIPEEFAIAKIKFEAGKNPAIKNSIWKWEALLPSQKTSIEKTFPGITAWYQNLASERKITVFAFTQDITPNISFEDLKDAGSLPTTTIDQIRYYTLRVQQELFNSENVRIEDFVSRNIRLYQSLNHSDQDSLTLWGYQKLWNEQADCYEHKQQSKTCTCGGKLSQLLKLDSCGSKQLDLGNSKDFDESTQILSALTSGDLSYIKTAKQKQLDIWGNVNSTIQKELVFLHLATLGETKIPDGSSVNLLFLWKKAEQTNSNEYLKRIGLSEDTIEAIQAYYSCILKAREVSKAKHRNEKSEEQATVIEEEVKQPVKVAQRTSYTAKNLDKAVTENLYLELRDREDLEGTCLKTNIVNDSTYELILDGCTDSSRQVFPIGKYEVPAIATFFNYCSNKIARELSYIPTNLVGGYDLLVTGTADSIPFADNKKLATDRGQYIADRLGKEVKAKSITVVPKIDLPVGRRYVALTFILRRNM